MTLAFTSFWRHTELFLFASPPIRDAYFHQKAARSHNRDLQQQIRRPQIRNIFSGSRKSKVTLLAGPAATEDGYELRLMTWLEVEDYVTTKLTQIGCAPIIVPVGATEQHGPSGLIGTDHMTAEAVAQQCSAATGALVAPTINVGMSMHHTGFAGTVSLSPATYIAVVRDYINSLSKSGFTHILFINGHGGNVMPILKAFRDHANSTSCDGAHTSRMWGSELPSVQLKLVNWYTGSRTQKLVQELYGKEVGQHATPDEVAITQHLFPRVIKDSSQLWPGAIQVADQVGGRTARLVDPDSGLPYMDPVDFRRRFPDGRMWSNPALANPQDGERILEVAVEDVIVAYHNFTGVPAAQHSLPAHSGTEKQLSGAPSTHLSTLAQP